MIPPADGEEIAPVIPLRQRPQQQPGAGRRLPQESAAFDPELEPAHVALRKRRGRRIRGGIKRPLRTLALILDAPAIRVLSLVGVGVVSLALVLSVLAGSQRHASSSRLSQRAQLIDRPEQELSMQRTGVSQTQALVSGAATQRSHKRTQASRRRHRRSSRPRAEHAQTSTRAAAPAVTTKLTSSSRAFSGTPQQSAPNQTPAVASPSPAETVSRASAQPAGPAGPGYVVGTNCNPQCK